MDTQMNLTVFCFGEVLWDLLPSGKKPGGAPLNVAIHLKKHGVNPVLVSKVGNDEMGKKLVHFLENAGVATSLVFTDPELPTSTVVVKLDKNRNATYEICKPVAWDNINNPEELKENAMNADLLIYGSLASRNKTTRTTLFQLLENTKATRLLDVNLRPPFEKTTIEDLLHLSDFIKLNHEELLEIASWENKTGHENILVEHICRQYNCKSVCVTRGENGALLYFDGIFYEHQGFKVTAEDTVGAGDAFLAALCATLFKNAAPGKALEIACATGALVASKKGAVPDYSEKEIQKIINR